MAFGLSFQFYCYFTQLKLSVFYYHYCFIKLSASCQSLETHRTKTETLPGNNSFKKTKRLYCQIHLLFI